MESKFDCHWKSIKTWVGMENSSTLFRRLNNSDPQKKVGTVPALILASVGLIKGTVVIVNGRKENGMVTTT